MIDGALQGLARISYHPPTTNADLRITAGRTPKILLNIVQLCLRRIFVRAARCDAHLDALATAGGEKCGLGVLVTRPAHQAEGLCRAIRAAGGEPVRFPVLTIAEPADPKRLLELLGRLTGFDLAIFISPNAVLRGMTLIAKQGGLPPGLVVAAVGKGSARELRHLGHPADLVPSGKANSEALLALPALQQVQGKRIIIFRGEGGRDLLGNTLRARGAQVEYAEVYRRVRPAVDTGPLLERWSKGEIGMVVVTSNEGLRNLYTLMGEAGRHELLATPLVVVSQRGAELAAELGWRSGVLVASGAGDEEIIVAVKRLTRLQSP